MTTWQTHLEAWTRDSEAALAVDRCFCVCGCQKTATHFKRSFGDKPHGYCDDCRALGAKHPKAHFVMVRAADNYIDFPIAKTILRESREHRVTDAMVDEAMAYLDGYTEGTKTLLALREKVLAGAVITNRQVLTVLSAKRGERRSVKALSKRIVREDRAVEYAGLDLSVLPEGSSFYAVQTEKGDWCPLRVERVMTGELAGFIFVHHLLSESKERAGAQYPGKGEIYRGLYTSVIAKVLSDPKRAERDYYRIVIDES